MQAAQVLHNSNASVSLLITIFYWAIVWPSLPEEAKYTNWVDKLAGRCFSMCIYATITRFEMADVTHGWTLG